jgi:hypothetical protein
MRTRADIRTKRTFGRTFSSKNVRYDIPGFNYTHTSLLDGYFIKSLINVIYSSQTNVDFLHNSDHFLVSLFLLHNILIVRLLPSPLSTKIRLLNPIPQTNLDLFNLSFFAAYSLQIDNLTNLFQTNDSLNCNHWQEACRAFEEITTNITKILYKHVWFPRSPNSPLTPTNLEVSYHKNYKNNGSYIS